MSKRFDWTADLDETKSPIHFNVPTMHFFKRVPSNVANPLLKPPRLVRTESVASHQSSCVGTFLIADDIELNRFVLKTMLTKYSWPIEETNNGNDAVALALKLWSANETEKIVIFMDVDMPMMDGLEATRSIREHCKTRLPVIVATTAFASEQERRACEEAGMDHFIPKPVTTRHLRELMSLVMGEDDN